MASGDEHTVLSVRGEARRTVASDQASVFGAVTEVADSKAAAAASVAGALQEVLAELAGLGGQPLTVQSTRSPLTWSTHSIQTHEEYDHDRRTGEHGPTGRHRATANLVISVRDFALLDAVGRLVTSRDDVDVHSVSWSVDDDNPEWAVVRADAIHAALLKGQDYASALGGTVVRVEHVADAGLLGGDASVPMALDRRALSARGGAESGTASLDPLPQVLSAIIEARLSAVVGPYPRDDLPP
jgi:uncharacterized protein YggE